jgi:cellulose synthase/poly-beta-1,6-N-acetylglucosamine synthase-like glycosyltransferase
LDGTGGTGAPPLARSASWGRNCEEKEARPLLIALPPLALFSWYLWSGRAPAWFVSATLYVLLGAVLLICVYAIRHYVFTLNRLLGKQRRPYIDIDTACWPPVTILVPAYNEEAVIADALDALLNVHYEPDKFTIVPINDHSTDRTREIIDSYAARFPERIKPVHRESGKRGKPAALKDAIRKVESDIVLVFDADYVPGKGLIKQLVAPFFDPEVGAVMGRVVPLNVGSNLLTRLCDLERAGGYQVDQQARMNLKFVSQYAGTVGGVRQSALDSVGSWREDTLAEDTDLTYRLVMGGWQVVYQNRSECYEEVPETWPVRMRQITRWAIGHNQSLARHAGRFLFSPRLSFAQRLDGLLLLGVFALSPVLVLAWALTMILFYLGIGSLTGYLAILAVACYSGLGNFAAFFEIAAALRLDRAPRRLRLLPFNILGFLVSLISISRATFKQVLRWNSAGELVWQKTERFRRTR